MTHTIIVLEGGLTGRVENPYYRYSTDEGIMFKHNQFAANNPPRPLTKYHEPGSKVRGREVWQYQHRGTTEWNAPVGLLERTFEQWTETMYILHDCVTRIAFEIIEEAAGDYNLPSVILSAGYNQSEWNACLDEVVKGLEKQKIARWVSSDVKYGYDYAKTEFLKTINSLRK